jgi:hypothetical protein
MSEMECTACGRMGSRDDGVAIGDNCVECGGELLWSGLIGFQENDVRTLVNELLEDPPGGPQAYKIRCVVVALRDAINTIDEAYLANDLTDPNASSGADDAEQFYALLTNLGYEVS